MGPDVGTETAFENPDVSGENGPWDPPGLIISRRLKAPKVFPFDLVTCYTVPAPIIQERLSQALWNFASVSFLVI